jgi:SAM-dependent methyltransferase
MEIVSRIERQQQTITGKTILEIGTGHQVGLPIALWLCGAAQIITVDLNRYLKVELVRNDLAFIRERKQELMQIFGAHAQEPEFRERLAALAEVTDGTLDQLLHAMNIRYLAPADAAHLDFPDGSIDYHVSYTVLEHIPPATLIRILHEGKRVLKNDGLFVHCIDFSDHFAHSDSSISSVNFLQFSDEEWQRLSGNRFMYHNRLRADEFRALLDESGVVVLEMEPFVDEKAKSLLEQGRLPLASRFHSKTPQTNATSYAWMVAHPPCRRV